MTVVENKWLEGPVRPDPRRRHRHRARGRRHAARRAERPLPPQRPQPDHARSTRPPTTGSSATGWCTACASREGQADWYRARMVRSTAVSEALGEEPAPGERHGGMDDRQHERDRPGRQDPRHRRGGRPARSSCPTSSTPCATPTSAARLPNGYTAHPKVDPATGKLHARRRTTGRSPTCSTSSSTPTAWCSRFSPIDVDRRSDGARLLDHRALDRRLRPPGHVRPRRRHGGRHVPLHVEGRPPRPRRADPARRRRRRRALVRGGALLRVPPAQRPRRR